MSKKTNKFVSVQEREYEMNEAYEQEVKKQRKQDYINEKKILDQQKKVISHQMENRKKNILIMQKDSTVSKEAINQYSQQTSLLIKMLVEQYYQDVRNLNAKYEKNNFLIERWFYGVNKELRRTTWAKKTTVILSFIIIIVIVLILMGIFYGIDAAFIRLSTK
ncbi:preprotein translocase subunit SecE [Ureaplasma miroungigenitalium]|uniref:Preprotein translocase subunit SecE n=1 Tax=Ureaplasma miroungigenitalium TaxID=1042321 RepID=A0ABT3BMV6_9BACT|nr:preprotein translocase subunit SecE [Ureaplasma miroungigenitalium]MCV3728421.1 preprotein translocase subunit SecE [Ureaplasma miroungigenitalium]MCV3734208.1 preprotein translocase subunit SecE [Ureaplasma miroungigenitalium]